MRDIFLDAPRVSAHGADFSWRVAPPAPLYKKTSFNLRFPEEIDLSNISRALWWKVFFICLHTHWAILRPCRVHLPIKLPPGEKEVWERLMAAHAMTLDTLAVYGEVKTGAAEIVEEGPSLEPADPLPELNRYAAAFSGGKDSLMQAGLLSELTDEPILVTTTSPMPPYVEHLTARRRRIFAEIVKRRRVRLIEVNSDFRASLDNYYPAGHALGTNEMCEVLLYFAALLVAGAALGATHLFVAAEAEAHENIQRGESIVQHRHFMYSSVTQRCLSTLLHPIGLRYCSLTSALHAPQVQELLWTRYSDLRDLQYSCWKMRRDESACSGCANCLQLALSALALGLNPEPMGINLVTLFNRMGNWRPRHIGMRDSLPTDIVARRLNDARVSDLRKISSFDLTKALASTSPLRMAHPSTWIAVLRFVRMRRRLAKYHPQEPAGYWPAFLRLVDDSLRDKVAGIYAESFTAASQAGYIENLQRSDALVSWITEPIGGER